MDNLLPRDGTAIYINNFLDAEHAARLLTDLVSNIKWKQWPIKIFGKSVLQPRLIAFYGDREVLYKYSGVMIKTTPWTESLLTVKHYIEAQTKKSFNCVLLNYYRDENDSMGLHNDNEKELGSCPTIASLSLGEKRRFRFKHIKQKELQVNVELEHNSLLIMTDNTQANWKHELPKVKSPKKARVNLTFRNIQS